MDRDSGIRVSSASSFSASRSAFTAHNVATDSLDLPALRQQDGANRNLERSSALARFHVLGYVAVTGAEGRDRLRSAPGGVERGISPSRLPGGWVVARRLLPGPLLPVGYQLDC
jgi:hypothetical protein